MMNPKKGIRTESASVKELIETTKEGSGGRSSGIVGTLVDYDAYGNDISNSTLTETPKIGIDMETIKWLQQNGYPSLTVADVEEEYSPGIYTSDPYLRHHRIELDSILAKVGAAGLWNYIMYRLQLKEFAPAGFDLNKAITMPENKVFYPLEVSNFLSFVSSYMDKILKDNQEEIEEELTGVTELPELKIKRNEIKERLGIVVSEDEGMRLIVSKLGPLLKMLRRRLEKEQGKGE